MKIKVFNFSGLFILVGTAFCTSLLISVDESSADGTNITALEILRASLSALIAMGGFFTRREVEVKNDEQ